ncbi:hypothetical protein MVEG_10516 [Podila verticillata NRRL 6337]|nr:hypothetical protein MVEG_10516 [Podila verticillata NRRL 6337]
MNFFRKKASQAQQISTTTVSRTNGIKSKRAESLTIEVQTPSEVTLRGNYRLPLIYNSAAVPTLLAALITFETPCEYAADEIEILFSVSANSQWQANGLTFLDGVAPVKSVKYFSKYRWTLPVTKNPSDFTRITPGKYTRLVHVGLDPTWPSSCIQPGGSIRYSFHVRALRPKPATPKNLASQDVWVIHRNVPALFDAQDLQPYVVTDLWKKQALPVSVTLPSQYLALGQVVLVTVALSPFVCGSKCEGQQVAVVGAQFVVQEASSVKVQSSDEPTPSRDVLAIALNDGWPSGSGGWERTVSLTLPGTPVMSPSMAAGVLDVSHTLVVTMKLRTEAAKQVEECKVTLSIIVVGPKPESNYIHLDDHDAQVPHYNDISHSIQGAHPGEELPSYLQREP